MGIDLQKIALISGGHAYSHSMATKAAEDGDALEARMWQHVRRSWFQGRAEHMGIDAARLETYDPDEEVYGQRIMPPGEG